MKKAFHRTISFVMAFVVLFSTMSFTISSHYCGDSLVDSSIFAKLKTCGMESETKIVNPLQSTGCSITKKDCCSDTQETVSGQNELQLSFDKISVDQHIFVTAFFHTYNNLFEESQKITPSSTIFPPPNIVRHIYKLDESYLI